MLIRALLGIMAALLISTSAFAADKGGKSGKIAAPVQDAAPAAMWAPSWTGFYAGVTGEYTTSSTEVAGILNFDAKDISYGVAFGYDHRLPGTTIVIGLMGDVMWQRGDSAVAAYDRSWFLGARAGMLFSPTVLVYALGGYTAVDGAFPSTSILSGASFPDSGMTLGAGIEAYMTKNLSLRLEYRRVDLGDSTGGLISNTQDGVRLGLNYRFDTLNPFSQ